MASPNWWAWVWVNSGSWWWTGRPGMLRFMGSRRAGHNWATELTDWIISLCPELQLENEPVRNRKNIYLYLIGGELWFSLGIKVIISPRGVDMNYNISTFSFTWDKWLGSLTQRTKVWEVALGHHRKCSGKRWRCGIHLSYYRKICLQPHNPEILPQ